MARKGKKESRKDTHAATRQFDAPWKKKAYALSKEIKVLQTCLINESNRKRIQELKAARDKLLKDHGVSVSVRRSLLEPKNHVVDEKGNNKVWIGIVRG